ncbi:MAG TPA: hypothetical protein DEG17_05160, partial [Cyanobacteria bacterium UBA11149]|nr:hypothetical protein [Cyanobacteria bacterium UBA11367]HBR75504.1 hypothetical protein [Cyanobacteria bacterium UBA11159]HBW88274.1 hypothetical protein [Cyanobacteria bacterium UBA11149]
HTKYGRTIYSSIAERNLVRSVLNKWKKGNPVIWSRIPERSILLFGGNTTEKAGRVDVLDTEHMKWLATFEFIPKHYPNMPWDNKTPSSKQTFPISIASHRY